MSARSMRRLACVAAALVSVVGPAAARAATGAGELLSRAVEQYGSAEFSRSLELLLAAEKLSTERIELGAIYRQRGLVEEVLGRPDQATVSFARALRCDPKVEVGLSTHKAAAVRLFVLAKSLVAAGTRVPALVPVTAITPDEAICASVDNTASLDAARDSPGAGPLSAEHASSTQMAQRGPGWAVWTAGGVALTALSTGAVFGVLAHGKDGECAAALDSGAFRACDASATRLERSANVAYGVAGGAGLVAIGLWLFAAPDAPAIALVPTRNGAALAWGARF